MARRSFPLQPSLSASPAKSDFSNLHPLVAKAGRRYEGGTPGPDGTYGEYFRGGLKLRVAPANLERGLKLLDQLFKALEAKGYKISEEGDRKDVHVLVDGEPVRVFIKEKLETRINKDHDPSKWSSRKRIFVPTGHLMFSIGDTYSYKQTCGDSTRWRADDRIDKTTEKIEEAARVQRESRIRRDKEHAEWEKEYQRRHEEEMRRLEIQKKGEAFLALMEGWKKAEEIRAFISQYRNYAAAAGKPITPESEEGLQMSWAERYANQIDPFASFKKEITEKR